MICSTREWIKFTANYLLKTIFNGCQSYWISFHGYRTKSEGEEAWRTKINVILYFFSILLDNRGQLKHERFSRHLHYSHHHSPRVGKKEWSVLGIITKIYTVKNVSGLNSFPFFKYHITWNKLSKSSLSSHLGFILFDFLSWSKSIQKAHNQ